MKPLAAKRMGVIALSFALNFSLFSNYAHATGIPVFDGGNLSQNMVTAFEAVAQSLTMMDQYMTQIDQYDTQLDQYDNMIRNTAAPAMYVWDKANSVISKVIETQQMMDFYSKQGFDLESYMSQYRSSGFYKSSPCYSARGCSSDDRQEVSKAQEMALDAQKQSADQLFRSIDSQQRSLKADAAQLERLQAQASDADGQMKAIQAANQLASAQTQQLMQIRAAMASEQTVLANKIASENDAAARDSAMKQRMTGGSYKPLKPQVW